MLPRREKRSEHTQLLFQEHASLLYGIGLTLVVLYLTLGVDDFIWDLISLALRPSYRKHRLDFRKLRAQPPKLLAVTVAAWHEENVLGDVIDHFIASTDYPRSMFHIFLGVYPNDPGTIAVAEALAQRHENVHVVINCAPGPTSKAQNINHVIRQIRLFEQERGWRFASLTIHDSEDVVHPYELRVTNYLLEEHDALQFPVFPLMKLPKLSNYLESLTSGTYADEFAENHFTTMVSRYLMGAFVPSAGTGFALSRRALDSFGDEDVLPSNSLTEDYRLSLTLFQRGIQMYYVLERVSRVDERRKVVWDYVATRSMFPSTFRTAVKQKTRWILGITMQSFRLRDVFQSGEMSFAGRYSLYKDLKAKVGNLLAIVGYPVLVYFLLSLFLPMQPIYPKGSLSWYLSLAVTVMMLERQVFRGVAIYHIYGLRSVFFACLLPPILPLRLIWGNFINMTATLRAYRQVLFPGGKKRAPTPVKKKKETAAPKQIAWAKTDHVFLEKKVLRRYQRTLGDVLLERGSLSSEALQTALKCAEDEGLMLGAHLMKEGRIGEDELLSALAGVKHIQYISPGTLEQYPLESLASSFDEGLLRKLLVLPLLPAAGGAVVAFCDESPQDAQTVLRTTYGIEVRAAFLSKKHILLGLQRMYHRHSRVAKTPYLERLYAAGAVSYEHVILVRNYAHLLGTAEEGTLTHMGLSTPALAAAKMLA